MQLFNKVENYLSPKKIAPYNVDNKGYKSTKMFSKFK